MILQRGRVGIISLLSFFNMPLFFINTEDVRGNKVRIPPDVVRHLRAFRLKRGDEFQVVDTRGTRYLVRLDRLEGKEAEAEIVREITGRRGSPLEILLAQGIPKGKKMDLILQKATELGVTRVIPVITERTIVMLSERDAVAKRGRWQKIVKEAAQQANRWDIPEISVPVLYADFFDLLEHQDISIILWEEEERQGLKDLLRGLSDIKKVAILIGPEGGFSKDEVELAKVRGFIPLSLGNRILRTETTGIAIISIIQYAIGDIG